MKKIVFLLSMSLLFGMQLSAQGWLDKVGKKAVNTVKQKVENRAVKKAGDATDKALDQLEKKDKKNVETEENKDASEQTSDKMVKEEKLTSTSKYDFIPGEKVIFFEDFSQDAVGDFPALWNTNGSGEVVETNLFPGHWLKFMPKAYAAIWTDELLKLPDNYTLEFDIIPTSAKEGEGMAGYQILLYKCKNLREIDGGSVPSDAGFWFTTEYYGTPRYRAYINKPESEHIDMSGSSDEGKYKQKVNQKYHIAIWVQKTRLRLYINENKAFDLPKAISTTSKFDRFRVADGAGLISNIRVAVGAPDMRNKLLTEGKLVTYGIYFDVNKDVVKAESFGTLKSIADVLKENPDVRIKITGHTDSDGDNAKNLDLSKRRAKSVMNELVKVFEIDASRIETDGMGETKPVAPNDNQVNKALNRRVEFEKL